jgi:hypothetical protein
VGLRSALAVTVWMASVASGMTVLWQYKNTAGADAAAPSDWPRASTIAQRAGRPTLVMFAHPRCPCTRASVSELARLMSQVHGQLDAHVLMLRPAGTEDGWERTDTWRSAALIPGVDVATDGGGREASLFGATVSGQTLLYDAAGRLVFRGGITGARGHEGDNSGRRRVVSFLTTGIADRGESPVFGCALFDAVTR